MSLNPYKTVCKNLIFYISYKQSWKLRLFFIIFLIIFNIKRASNEEGGGASVFQIPFMRGWLVHIACKNNNLYRYVMSLPIFLLLLSTAIVTRRALFNVWHIYISRLQFSIATESSARLFRSLFCHFHIVPYCSGCITFLIGQRYCVGIFTIYNILRLLASCDRFRY